MNAAYATKEREAQIREREVAIQAEIEADLYRQAETERELEASHRAAEKSEMAKIEAAKELQKDIQQQLIQKEQEKEFAYQQESIIHFTFTTEHTTDRMSSVHFPLGVSLNHFLSLLRLIIRVDIQ